MYIEFIPGNYATNPKFEYFVLVIHVGGNGRLRDTSKISVRIIDGKLWPGINTAPFKYAHTERALRSMTGKNHQGNSDSISLVGYDITVRVDTAIRSDTTPYHSIYLDWEKATRLSQSDTKESPNTAMRVVNGCISARTHNEFSTKARLADNMETKRLVLNTPRVLSQFWSLPTMHYIMQPLGVFPTPLRRQNTSWVVKDTSAHIMRLAKLLSLCFHGIKRTV